MLVRYAKGGVRAMQLNRHGQNDPLKAKLLSDPNFMKAISYAFDRQAFVDKVLRGNAMPATVQAPAATAVSGIRQDLGRHQPELRRLPPGEGRPGEIQGVLDAALKNAGLSSVAEIPAVRPADQRGSAGPEDGDALFPQRPHQPRAQGQSRAGDRQSVLDDALQAGARLRFGGGRLGTGLRRPDHLHGLLELRRRWTWA